MDITVVFHPEHPATLTLTSDAPYFIMKSASFAFWDQIIVWAESRMLTKTRNRKKYLIILVGERVFSLKFVTLISEFEGFFCKFLSFIS